MTELARRLSTAGHSESPFPKELSPLEKKLAATSPAPPPPPETQSEEDFVGWAAEGFGAPRELGPEFGRPGEALPPADGAWGWRQGGTGWQQGQPVSAEARAAVAPEEEEARLRAIHSINYALAQLPPDGVVGEPGGEAAARTKEGRRPRRTPGSTGRSRKKRHGHGRAA